MCLSTVQIYLIKKHEPFPGHGSGFWACWPVTQQCQLSPEPPPSHVVPSWTWTGGCWPAPPKKLIWGKFNLSCARHKHLHLMKFLNVICHLKKKIILCVQVIYVCVLSRFLKSQDYLQIPQTVSCRLLLSSAVCQQDPAICSHSFYLLQSVSNTQMHITQIITKMYVINKKVLLVTQMVVFRLFNRLAVPHDQCKIN